jgi:hypothetical protein
MVRVQKQLHCNLSRIATTHTVTIAVITMITMIRHTPVSGVVGIAERAVGEGTHCCPARRTLGFLRNDVVVGADVWA